MQKFNSKTVANRKIFERQELLQIDLDSEMRDGKRYYWTPDGALYPSVTTITGSIEGKKEGLQRWVRNVGEAEAERIKKRAAERGTHLHTICEDYLMNKEHIKLDNKVPVSIELFHNIKPILDEHIEVIYGNEMALFSHTLRTAGRSDLFCRFMGMNTIADFKSSTKEKKPEWIEDYFIQSTAYAIMLEELYSDVKPIHIPQIAIIIAVEEGDTKYQLFVKKTSDYRQKTINLFNKYHEKNPLPKAVRTLPLFEG